jgi:hypothetical protein
MTTIRMPFGMSGMVIVVSRAGGEGRGGRPPMSRGFGKWQRLILEELARRDRFYLLELLPVGYRKAQHNALARAAHVLARRDTIDLWRYDTGGARMLCLRPGSLMRVGDVLTFPEERPPLRRRERR